MQSSQHVPQVPTARRAARVPMAMQGGAKHTPEAAAFRFSPLVLHKRGAPPLPDAQAVTPTGSNARPELGRAQYPGAGGGTLDIPGGGGGGWHFLLKTNAMPAHKRQPARTPKTIAVMAPGDM